MICFFLIRRRTFLFITRSQKLVKRNRIWSIFLGLWFLFLFNETLFWEIIEVIYFWTGWTWGRLWKKLKVSKIFVRFCIFIGLICASDIPKLICGKIGGRRFWLYFRRVGFEILSIGSICVLLFSFRLLHWFFDYLIEKVNGRLLLFRLLFLYLFFWSLFFEIFLLLRNFDRNFFLFRFFFKMNILFRFLFCHLRFSLFFRSFLICILILNFLNLIPKNHRSHSRKYLIGLIVIKWSLKILIFFLFFLLEFVNKLHKWYVYLNKEIIWPLLDIKIADVLFQKLKKFLELVFI